MRTPLVNACTTVGDQYKSWLVFSANCYEGYKSELTISKIGKMTNQLLKNEEVKTISFFLASFNRYYWCISYNWLRRKDEITKKEGHICHECLLHMFIAYCRLEKLLNGGWKQVDKFKTCFEVWKELDDSENSQELPDSENDDENNKTKEKKMSSRASVEN